MHRQELRLFSIIVIAISIFNIFVFNVFPEEIESPVCPIVYADGNGGFELYWFYSGKNVINPGNNSIIPQRGVMSSMIDRQYCIFTGIKLTPPIYIEKTNTYIMNSDLFPDLPGDQFTPIRLAVKEKVSDNYYEDLWFEYVSLPADADFPGEVVEGVTNLSIDDLFVIYLALEWLPGTPTSPLIGVNSQPPYLYQTISPMDDSSFQTVYTTACAMVGAGVLSWRPIEVEAKPEQRENGEAFQVLFSEDSTGIFSDGEIITSVVSDSLTAKFNLRQSGYIAVKAVNAEGESYSDILFLDKGKLPPITIRPGNLFPGNMNMQDSSKIILENTGMNSLELTLNYDTSLFLLSGSSFLLETGASAEIIVEIKDDIDISGPISSPIIIRAAGDYYPQIIHVSLSEKISTLADNNIDIIPEKFNISRPYPNPFNTTVRFDLTRVRHYPVKMDIYNLLGQKIFSQALEPDFGPSVRWNGTDKTGRAVGSGIYFMRFSAGETTIIRKAVLLK